MEGLLIMKAKPISKKHKEPTPEEFAKWKKETGACDHNKIGYSALTKLALGMFARSRKDAKHFVTLLDIINGQKRMILDQKRVMEKMIDCYEDRFEEYQRANKDFQEKNTDLILQVDELKKRLFGHFERKLEFWATRPDRKKDN